MPTASSGEGVAFGYEVLTVHVFVFAFFFFLTGCSRLWTIRCQESPRMQGRQTKTYMRVVVSVVKNQVV